LLDRGVVVGVLAPKVFIGGSVLSAKLARVATSGCEAGTHALRNNTNGNTRRPFKELSL
jgi:hypothetical protein